MQYNRFDAAVSGLSDTDWWSVTGELKYDILPASLKPFVAGGAGIYIPKSGSTKPGIYLGLGLVRAINHRWDIEAGADYHNIFTSGSDTRYSVIRIGLTYHFK